MADDPNPALRAELKAALTVLAPQIRGLHDLAGVSISPDLASEVQNQITMRQRRRELINVVLDALDAVFAALVALEGDGYPKLEQNPLIPALFAELQQEQSDLVAAWGVFAQSMAAQMSVALGSPTEKPNL